MIWPDTTVKAAGFNEEAIDRQGQGGRRRLFLPLLGGRILTASTH